MVSTLCIVRHVADTGSAKVLVVRFRSGIAIYLFRFFHTFGHVYDIVGSEHFGSVCVVTAVSAKSLTYDGFCVKK